MIYTIYYLIIPIYKLKIFQIFIIITLRLAWNHIYMKNIWNPISENSNEDLDENYWITGVLKAYEMVHIHYTHSIDRRCGKSHARMNRYWRIIMCCRGHAGPVIITVLKSRVLGAILIICRDFFGYTIVCGFPLDRA